MQRKFWLTLLILTVLGTGLYFWRNLNSPKTPAELPFFKQPDSYLVRPLRKPKPSTGNELMDKALLPSLHGGVAVFIGSYRLELAVYGLNGSSATYGVYLDNSLAQPIVPRDTEIFININNKLLKLQPLRNGLFTTIGPLPNLPQTIQVVGKFNNKKFSANLELVQFRSKKITALLD